MSRTIGDTKAETIGVVCTGEITVHEIDKEKDKFIVIGSDGI